MYWLLLVLKIIGIAILIALVGGFVLTWRAQSSASQDIFAKGTVPAQLPDGLHNGFVTFETTWKGKIFHAHDGTGINLIGESEKYPFNYYVADGLHDDMKVIRLDYNKEGNPFWLKRITDEIVQVAPNEYLGKVHVRVIPGYAFTAGYFRLLKK